MVRSGPSHQTRQPLTTSGPETAGTHRNAYTLPHKPVILAQAPRMTTIKHGSDRDVVLKRETNTIARRLPSAIGNSYLAILSAIPMPMIAIVALDLSCFISRRCNQNGDLASTGWRGRRNRFHTVGIPILFSVCEAGLYGLLKSACCTEILAQVESDTGHPDVHGAPGQAARGRPRRPQSSC